MNLPTAIVNRLKAMGFNPATAQWTTTTGSSAPTAPAADTALVGPQSASMFGGGGSSRTWLWVGIAAAAVVGGVMLYRQSRRR